MKTWDPLAIRARCAAVNSSQMVPAWAVLAVKPISRATRSIMVSPLEVRECPSVPHAGNLVGGAIGGGLYPPVGWRCQHSHLRSASSFRRLPESEPQCASYRDRAGKGSLHEHVLRRVALRRTRDRPRS